MTRRRLVALVSALTLVALCLVVLVALLSVTRTSYGRDKVRAYLESRIASRVKGRVHIGQITGGLLGGVRIDTLEIRDAQDSLFFASGPLTVEYDIRDFFDRRILLERLEVERPIIRIDQTEEGEWNYRRIFPRAPRRLPQIQGGLGDYIVADNVVIRDGTLIVRLPWHTADSLTGARRDSAATVALARKDAEITRRSDGLVRTRRWTDIDLVSNYVRWADPDSIGRHIDIRSLAARESDPPIAMTDAEGFVRILGDSLWLDVPSFDITASTGSAKGKIVWGSRLPTRYDVEIKGDSVSLADIAWVYPTLPTTGSGSMRLHILSRRANPRVIDYAISGMDVRTTGSRLRGDMTFGVGGPVLEVTDVELDAQPVDFRLIETLSGERLPVPWAGTIRGSARGPGGPVTRFVVDDAQMTFSDANVPGAVSRASGRGGLDILYPSLAKFQGFAVDVGHLDLRTIEFLFPNFPRLGGTVTGRATLDSSWLDVRFSQADVTHLDGPAPPTRLTGSGRVTYGEPFLAYDVDLVADSLSFTSLARSYPDLPLRGSYAGPIRARGTTEALDMTVTLAGAAGRMAFDGRVDAYPPGYAARGRASLTEMNVARLLERTDLPETRISAQFEGDVTGDSLANLGGLLAFDTDRSRIADVTLRRPTAGRLLFEDGRLTVLELVAVSDRFTLSATGGLGLTGGVRDSMRFRVIVDSLGSLRPWLKPLDSARIAEELPEDSLGGSLRLEGHVAGNLERMDLSGDLSGVDLVFGRGRARAATGRLALVDVLGARSGRVDVRLDTVALGDRRLDSVRVAADFADADRGRVTLAARAADLEAHASAAFRIAGDTTDLLVDSVRVFPRDGGDWRLRAPARVVVAGDDYSITDFAVGSDRGGRFALSGTLPGSGQVALRVDADSVDLGDASRIVTGEASLTGWLDAGLSIAGTRAAPTMQGSAELVGGRFGEVRTERLTMQASYADRRLAADVALLREGVRAVGGSVSVPIDLALVPVGQRLLDEPLRGSIRADSVDMRLLEAFSSEIRGATGRLRAQVALGGTAREPRFDGGLTIVDGGLSLRSAGIDLQSVTADIGVNADSLFVRTFRAASGPVRGNFAELRGTVRFADRARDPEGIGEWILGENPVFALAFSARDFRAVRSRIAELNISGGLRLSGPLRGAQLSGSVTVPDGDLFIPDIFDKRLVSLEGIDTTFGGDGGGLLRDTPSALLENLDVRGVDIIAGNNVWLRSAQARIQLGGSVSVRSVRVPARDPLIATNGERADSVYRLALEGVLTADRGQYTLNLNVVQRTFAVERGTVTFFGDAELNPTLDITAVYTVRTPGTDASGRDVRIRVHIYGTLAQPLIGLSSADGTLPLSNSDLISYLVTGSPEFELGAEGRSNLQIAASILLPSLGTLVGDRLGGSTFDLFQLEAANSSQIGRGQSFGEFLMGTRLGVGKQITNRTFVRATTNLCRIDDLLANLSDPDIVRQSIGVKVETNLNHGVSFALSVEPGSSALGCTNPTQRGFLLTPPQIGLDLFKVWRF